MERVRNHDHRHHKRLVDAGQGIVGGACGVNFEKTLPHWWSQRIWQLSTTSDPPA